MKMQDMLSTGVGVLLVSKVEVLAGNIELNYWEEQERERTTPVVAFDCGFLTQENAHTFPILICRDSRWSNGSYMLRTEWSHRILYFISCWFHQRSCFSQNHFEMR